MFLDLISVVCYIICAVIPLSAKSIVLMFITAICQNMEYPYYNALTADMTKTEDRERAYSLQYLWHKPGVRYGADRGGLSSPGLSVAGISD